MLGISILPLYDFSVIFWNCSDSVVLFVFHLIAHVYMDRWQYMDDFNEVTSDEGNVVMIESRSVFVLTRMQLYCYLEIINGRIIPFNNWLCSFHKLKGKMVKHGDYFRLMTVELWDNNGVNSTKTFVQASPKTMPLNFVVRQKGKNIPLV